MSEVKMVVTDLDGTLLQTDHSISDIDLETLEKLGTQGICRVAATGRNLFKVKQVLSIESPFDYVIFSLGAGIIGWKKQELIRSVLIPVAEATALVSFLIQEKRNFKAALKIPENHHFIWWKSSECEELKRYIDHYKKYISPKLIVPGQDINASQLLVFLPNNEETFEELKKRVLNNFPNLSVIRSTSPINPDYIWMEILPKGISKANGVEEICRITGISRENTFGIGNDFNDLELLDFTKHSYVVDNAPGELKKKYKISRAHHENGFTHAVNRHFDH